MTPLPGTTEYLEYLEKQAEKNEKYFEFLKVDRIKKAKENKERKIEWLYNKLQPELVKSKVNKIINFIDEIYLNSKKRFIPSMFITEKDIEQEEKWFETMPEHYKKIQD